MPRNNSRYSPENSEHLNNGYNAGETLKETFPPEKIVEAARNSPLEPAVDLGEGIKKFKDGEPGAEWSIGKSIWGAFGGGVIGKLIGGGTKGAATGAVVGSLGTAGIDYAQQKHKESQRSSEW